MALHNAQVYTGKLNGQRAVFFAWQTTRNGMNARVVQFMNGETMFQTKLFDAEGWKDCEDFNADERAAYILRVEAAVK